MATVSSITATWSAGSGGTPDTYDFRWRLQGDVSWTTITGLTDTTYTVTSLDSGQTVEWQVRAVNGAGTSDWSSTATCTTIVPVTIPYGSGPLCGWRGHVGINWLGKALVGDKYSAVIGFSDFSTFTEYGNPMIMTITTPVVQKDRKRVFMTRFEVDMQVGEGIPGYPSITPVASLEVSKDSGMTFTPLSMPRSMGKVGQYTTRLRWLNLGQSRGWVFRLVVSDPTQRSVIGCYYDAYEGLG